MENSVYIHEIKLPETDNFSKQFNHISDLWQKSQDLNLSEEQRREAAESWLQQRQCLELGIN